MIGIRGWKWLLCCRLRRVEECVSVHKSRVLSYCTEYHVGKLDAPKDTIREVISATNSDSKDGQCLMLMSELSMGIRGL